MSQLAIAIVIIEVILAFAVIWGFLNEDFLIRVENRFFAYLAGKIRGTKNEKNTRTAILVSENENSPYAA